MAGAIPGMRGSGSWTAAEKPLNWRQMILLLFPNGDCPLVGMLSKAKEQPTDSTTFNFFEKGLPEQRAIILGASTTLGSVPAVGADIAANDANARIALRVQPIGASGADTSIYKVGHVLYNQAKDESYYILQKLTDTGVDYLVVLRNLGGRYTLGTNNPAVTGDATAGDSLLITGTAFPEGADVGQAVVYPPIKHYNLTQIFRSVIQVTRTARRTKLRTDATGPYRELKREALQLHGIEMEKAFWWGERSELVALTSPSAPLDVTSASQPTRTTRGVVNWLPGITSGAAPTIHYDLGTANAGGLTEKLWTQWLEVLFRFGTNTRTLFCGSTALGVITEMAKSKGTIEIMPETQTYGMAIMRYLTPFGTVQLVNHPLFSNDPLWRKDICALDLDKLTYRYIDDTMLRRNVQNPGLDASVDEYLTEAGLEVHFSGATPDSSDGLPSTPGPPAHGRLKGVAAYTG